MSTLHLTIGGRSFALAVEPGDEDHVRRLGRKIDAKFQQLAPRYSQNLLFAALQLADDLHQSQNGEMLHSAIADEAIPASAEQTGQLLARIADLEQQLAASEAAKEQSVFDASVDTTVDTGAFATDPELAFSLERFAELLENCADKLEGRAAAP